MHKHPLTYILIFALLLRIVFLFYGLPLWVYNDEPPFILAALKMMQLKSVLPVLHQADFTPFLYYPPYISYLLLPFFGIATLFSFFTFHGSFHEFQSVIAANPSLFFITARLIVIALSLLSIYFIYRIILTLSKNRNAALVGAFLTSTSIMHIALSVTAKQWMPIFFFYTLGLFILSHPTWSLKKRYWLAALITGIGMGISTIIVLFTFIMAYWYIFYDKKTYKEFIRGGLFYQLAIIVIAFAIIPILLYPASLGFIPDVTLHDPKTFLGFILSPFMFTLPLLATEPILVLLSLIGIILGFKKYRSFYITSIAFTILYSFVFYVFFRFEYRFLLPLILFISIGAGIGILELKEKISKKIFFVILSIIVLISLCLSLRFAYFGIRNDSRILAKNWLEKNADTGEKVMVYANLMRLPNNIAGVTEQEYIDPNSLRTNDKSEKTIKPEQRKEKVFHALNLYTVKNDNFYSMIAQYAKKNNYKYLIVATQDFLNNTDQFTKVRKLLENATLVARFGNNESGYSLGKTEIGPTLTPLFKIEEFGPEIEIYKLK